MLQRMYLRWAELNGYKTEIIDSTEGEVAGIKQDIREAEKAFNWQVTSNRHLYPCTQATASPSPTPTPST